nr:hypothetical protein [Tanacetum cinerariifolium]
CKLFSRGNSSTRLWEHFFTSSGKIALAEHITGSGKTALEVGMDRTFNSQQSSPKLDAASAINKINDLKSELSDANTYWYSYKLGVAQLEERLNEYKDRDEKYIVKIRTLEMYRESNLESIKILTNEVETLKEEKDVVDGKLARLRKSSKDLEDIIESQRSDKVKEGVGYNVVPPPAADLYHSPKKDLSWTSLPEFADDIVTDYSRPSPTVENTTAEGDRPAERPTTNKAEFVKAAERLKTDKVETAKKLDVRYAELYRRTSKRSTVRGNQRNWNNLKSYQLGLDFVLHKKPCFNCGDFSHLANDCRKRVQRETTRSQNHAYKSPSHRSYGAPMRPSHGPAVRPQYRASWVPTFNRNIPPVNRKLPTGNSNVSTICCCYSRHVNTARPKAVINRRNRVKDVQASACWVWKSVKPNSASIILKIYDYVDVRGRSSFPTSSDVFPLPEEVPTARRKFPLPEEVPTGSAK